MERDGTLEGDAAQFVFLSLGRAHFGFLGRWR